MTSARTRRGPRFEYLTDAAPRGRSVEPSAGLATTFAWRLVAANNRPVGRAWVDVDAPLLGVRAREPARQRSGPSPLRAGADYAQG